MDRVVLVPKRSAEAGAYLHVWTFRTAGESLIDCVMQCEDAGVEVQILYEGRPIISCLCSTGIEALAWADGQLRAFARVLASSS